MSNSNPFNLTEEELRIVTQGFQNVTPPKLLTKLSETQTPTIPDLQIRTKDKDLIPFNPNAIQETYLHELIDTYQTHSSISPFNLIGTRELILKGRQFGLSTLILGLYYLNTITTPRTHTVVIAHDLESTTTLFETVKRFHENIHPKFRKDPKLANKRELYWSQLDSSFTVGTAGSKDFGRGRTINNVHMSEVAFWPDAQAIVGGLLQAVPQSGNIFGETTANGLGNWFEEEWSRAENNQSVFRKRFFCWKDFPEYRLTLDSASSSNRQFVIQSTSELTPEELLLQENFQLDLSQLSWRRMKQTELGKLFKQEYPLTPEEAFLVTGTPYFDREKLSEIVPKPKTLQFAIPFTTPPKPSTKFLSRNAEFLEIYEEPNNRSVYVIGADTMEGPSSDDPDSVDFDSADVLKVTPHYSVQVAHLHGRWDTREFGILLSELATFYNTALLLVERNNHGHAVIQTLLHEVFYPMQGMNGGGGLYLHTEYDRHTRYESRKPGFPTTQRTKYLALDMLKTSLEENTLRINSAGTLKELLRFVKKPGGKAGGEGTSKDDRVMSLAIANYGTSMAPFASLETKAGGERTIFTSAPISTSQQQRSYTPPGFYNGRR